MTSQPERRQLVSIQDAADYLGVNHHTIRRIIARGELAAVRVGKSRIIRVDLAQIDAELLRPIPAVQR